ncbi:hypothetical protein E4K73_49150 [Streptomyces sp. IB201691-2A2]|nr:hypothetical protein E4K73_49150 [Streptomyces sp. IB201691-2A2]
MPRAPEAIAADVASVLVKSTGSSPKGTTILVRNQVRRDDRGSAEQLAAVATHLAEAGVTALCEIPSDLRVREAAGKALLTPRDGLVEAFDRLAELAARGL